MKKLTLFIIAIITLLLGTSCASSGQSVSRVDSGTQTDLSGFWNDTDVRIVCQALIDSCLRSGRVQRAIEEMGGKAPVVLVGQFRNESSEHIDTNIIATTMETVIFNSGKMDFVAGGNIRNQLRAERQQQQDHASEATAAALANEVGADFMLFGTVRSIVDRAGNQTVRTYFVSAELTNIETGQRMWMDTNSEIKKVITQPKNRM